MATRANRAGPVWAKVTSVFGQQQIKTRAKPFAGGARGSILTPAVAGKRYFLIL